MQKNTEVILIWGVGIQSNGVKVDCVILEYDGNENGVWVQSTGLQRFQQVSMLLSGTAVEQFETLGYRFDAPVQKVRA